MNFHNTSKSAAAFFLLTLFSVPAMAHNLWIETDPTGKVGQSQTVHVYLGEYAYGVRENIQEHTKEVGPVTLSLIKPNGETVELRTTINGNRFTAEFTPKQKGSYQLALNVLKAPVVDWTEYDLGILKTNFFSSATVRVGSTAGSNLPLKSTDTNNQLIVQPTKAVSFERQSPLQFKVTYKGKPLADQEVKVGYEDRWFKTLYTDEEGLVTTSLPWEGQFVIETVYTEETAGTFKGDDFEAIRQTATFSIPATR